MTRPFLVTGCGRSGTGWAAALFTALGYPCGHEAVFGPDGPGAFHRPDSSWLAVPHAASLPAGTPLLRVMRNPYAAVQSAFAKGFLAEMSDPYSRYVRRYRPRITRPDDHLARVIRWVALWDDPLDDLGHLLVPIETGNMALAVEHATGDRLPDEAVQDALVVVGMKVNTVLDPWQVRPSYERIMDHPDAPLLASRARRFGYY